MNAAVAVGFRPAKVMANQGLPRGREPHACRLARDQAVQKAVNVSSELNRVRSVVKPVAWIKVCALFQANREEFDRRYHARSSVESVVPVLKRQFGENIRSRTPTTKVNEVLCKLIAYNLTVVVHEMFENGIAPSFVKKNQGS